MDSVFDHAGYRDFLRAQFPSKGELRGRRKFLADHLNCQVSLIGLVLTDRAHLNEEMLLETSDFLKLNPSEREYFLLLGHFEKANSVKLKDFYQTKLNELKARHRRIEAEVKADVELNPMVQSLFFSQWIFLAIQAALTAPHLRTEEALASALAWPLSEIQTSVRFLLENGLVKREGDKLIPSGARVHLKRTSPLVPGAHTSWRMEAGRQVLHNRSDNLHFSAAYTLSREDFVRVRQLFEESIVRTEKIIQPSKEEELMGLTLDCWKY